MIRLSQMSGEDFSRWESSYLREREPHCDVCGSHAESVDWCGECGCCKVHCQDFVECG